MRGSERSRAAAALWIVLPAALLAGFSTPQVTEAAAIAYARIEQSDLVARDARTGLPLRFGTDIGVPLRTEHRSTARARVAPGDGGSDVDAVVVPPGSGDVDALPQCFGDCDGIAGNDFHAHVDDPGRGTFAFGDSKLDGALIAGVTPPEEIGSNARMQAEALLRSPGQAAAAGTVEQLSDFFLLPGDPAEGGLRTTLIELDVEREAILALDTADPAAGTDGSAFARIDWSFAVKEAGGDTLVSWIPDGRVGGAFFAALGGRELSDPFDVAFSRRLDGADSVALLDSGRFAAEVVLPTGLPLQFHILAEAEARATLGPNTVPEMGTLALLGSGLIGLWTMRHARPRLRWRPRPGLGGHRPADRSGRA
jgi:hypothetical protein